MQEKKGISLIVLIVTIIVMIIIAGAVIISLSNTNIIDQAEKAKTKWDIASIKEQLIIHNALAKTGTNAEIKNGTLKDIGIDDEAWNEKVVIQDGKLVFLPENLTDNEEASLLEAGIERSEHISIVNTTTKASKYADDDSVVAVEGLYDKLIEEPDTEKVYIIEDLTGWDPDIYNNQLEYYGVLDGLGHTVTNLEMPMFFDNYATIRGITTIGTFNASECWLWGSITEMNYKIIEDCHNEANIFGGEENIGGIAAMNEGTIYRCSNSGIVTGNSMVGGIVAYNEYIPKAENEEHKGAMIIECVNYGKVGAYDENGNIIETTTIEKIGGIVGSNSGICYNNNITPINVYNCYNAGEISGGTGVAGLIGYTNDSKSTIIKNSYNIGNVYATSDFASIGFFHSANVTIANCFAKKNTSTELVNFDINRDNKTANVDWINNLVNDGELETEADIDKLLEMLNAGNSEEVWVKDTNNINNGYPILKWQLSK